MELSSGRGAQRSKVTGKFIGVKDAPHCSLKTRKLGRKLGVLFGCLCEVQQLLADQIIQGVFQPESPSHTASSLALFFPNPVALHNGDYTGTMCWSPSAGSTQWGALSTRKKRTADQIIEPRRDRRPSLLHALGPKIACRCTGRIQEGCVISNDATGSAANSLIHWAKKGSSKRIRMPLPDSSSRRMFRSIRAPRDLRTVDGPLPR